MNSDHAVTDRQTDQQTDRQTDTLLTNNDQQAYHYYR